MGLETAAIIAAVAAAIPAVVGIGKQLFPGDSGVGGVQAAGAQKIADMQKAASAYGAYRPDQADARMKAMSQQLSSYQGAGNMMQAMYGGAGSGPAGPTSGTLGDPGGGYAKPDGTRTPVDPRTGGPVPSDAPPNGWTQAEWEAQRRAMDAAARAKTANGGTSGQGGTPPIFIPRETPTGSGSSGPMLTGDTGGMAALLGASAPPPGPGLMAPTDNGMAAMLARKRSL
jgi:hypothetical protein